LIALYIPSLVVGVVTTHECISMPSNAVVDYVIGSKCLYLHSSSMQNETTSTAKFRLISFSRIHIYIYIYIYT
jgi:hypothetical protein